MRPSSFAGAQWQHKVQWAQIGAQEVPQKHEELCCEGGRAQKQAAQRGCGVSLGDVWILSCETYLY